MFARVHQAVAGRIGTTCAAALWIFVVLNFGVYRLWGSDAKVQFGFLRRLFGESHHALGYQFGFALVEAPFYALGKVFHAVGWTTIAGQPIAPATIAVGIGFLVLAGGWLMLPVFRELNLPHPALALSTTAFGTPLFYYAVQYPGKTHATDTVLIAVLVVLLHRYFYGTRKDLVIPLAMGLVSGFAMTVRYFNGPASVAIVVGLAIIRRYRDAIVVGLTAAVTCGLLFLLPIALHTPIFVGKFDPNNTLTFQIWNLPKMLFTDHRGMFVWAPVSILGVLGYIRLIRVRKGDRPFFAISGAMGLLIMFAYEFVPFWDGGYTFGQRFFTPLAALIAIGVSGLMEVNARVVGALALVAAVWTTFLMFNLITIGGPLYAHRTTGGGASNLAARVYDTQTSFGAYVYGLYYRSKVKAFIPYPFSRH